MIDLEPGSHKERENRAKRTIRRKPLSRDNTLLLARIRVGKCPAKRRTPNERLKHCAYGHRMSFKSWWKNENYNREHMQRFREERPEWSDLPNEAVATSMAFQTFAASVAFSDLWKEIKHAVITKDTQS